MLKVFQGVMLGSTTAQQLAVAFTRQSSELEDLPAISKAVAHLYALLHISTGEVEAKDIMLGCISEVHEMNETVEGAAGERAFTGTVTEITNIVNLSQEQTLVSLLTDEYLCLKDVNTHYDLIRSCFQIIK